MPPTVSYSGLSHFCFWQCSDRRLTGSFPVHDEPPMICFTVGLGGPSGVSPGADEEAGWAEADGPAFFGLLSLVELVKTMNHLQPGLSWQWIRQQ